MNQIDYSSNLVLTSNFRVRHGNEALSVVPLEGNVINPSYFSQDGVLIAGPKTISAAKGALAILEGDNPLKMFVLLTIFYCHILNAS